MCGMYHTDSSTHPATFAFHLKTKIQAKINTSVLVIFERKEFENPLRKPLFITKVDRNIITKAIK